MKQSQKNLDVINNFILHLTHCGEHGLDSNFNDLMRFTPEEMYRIAKEYIDEDHVDGVDADEPEVNDIQVHVQKISDTRDDSFWYYDKCIASCLLEDGNTVEVRSFGVQGITLLDAETFYRNEDAVRIALQLGLQDEYIQDEDKVAWSNNNWFGLTVIDPKGNIVVDDDGDVDYSYDDAINTIISYVQENKS